MATATVQNQTTVNPGAGTITSLLVQLSRAAGHRISRMYGIYGERQKMRELSDEVLKDIGITRAQLNEECSRSIVDVPHNRC